MDISNEASVDPFPIGPSTIVGRTIAFRVLFCKSMSHLRHQIFRTFLSFVYRFKNFLAPMFSWLHPRNPQGILAMVTIIAFFVETLHECQSQGRNGLSEEILEKYDENCFDL